MKYSSKKDWWLTVIVFGGMIFAIWSSGSAVFEDTPNVGETIVALLVPILLSIFILWLWLTTYYVIDDKNLIVRYGPFKKIIPFYSIKSVKKTMNPLSSPALSLKRLEITYGQYDTVLISPKDRDEFMDVLANHCPHAKIIKS
ncbi:PH domain-containing protein [Neobacillus rhizophilus]|uniref:PH domain-containing protein n=1 Tax=Neobacillus rhizophilus TaxID=2833579 RepID=A0A942YSI2_9BACI|nr:PH domain-containing protein [Neobacillus rhizophilus]MBS4210897.1 PH domain-containing protein [Neobacillus rhizophilus]